MQTLLEQVKAHARTNYCKGWDVIVECYSDNDIQNVIKGKRTLKGAIKAFEPVISHWVENASPYAGEW